MDTPGTPGNRFAWNTEIRGRISTGMDTLGTHGNRFAWNTGIRGRISTGMDTPGTPGTTEPSVSTRTANVSRQQFPAGKDSNKEKDIRKKNLELGLSETRESTLASGATNQRTENRNDPRKVRREDKEENGGTNQRLEN